MSLAQAAARRVRRTANRWLRAFGDRCDAMTFMWERSLTLPSTPPPRGRAQRPESVR